MLKEIRLQNEVNGAYREKEELLETIFCFGRINLYHEIRESLEMYDSLSEIYEGFLNDEKAARLILNNGDMLDPYRQLYMDFCCGRSTLNTSLDRICFFASNRDNSESTRVILMTDKWGFGTLEKYEKKLLKMYYEKNIEVVVIIYTSYGISYIPFMDCRTRYIVDRKITETEQYKAMMNHIITAGWDVSAYISEGKIKLIKKGYIKQDGYADDTWNIWNNLNVNYPNFGKNINYFSCIFDSYNCFKPL